MKTPHLQFVGIISLAALLLLATACEDQTEKNRLEKLSAAAKMHDQNKGVVREVFAAIDSGKFDKLKGILSDDFVLNAPGAPHPWKQEDLFQGIRSYYASFPDWTHTIEDMIAEGDKIVVNLKGQGTFKIQYEGLPPTGEKVTQSAMHLLTIVNGKVKEWWAAEDNLGLMQQLGMGLKPTKSKK